MNVGLHLCILLCIVNANAAAVSHLTQSRKLQDSPYEDIDPGTVSPQPTEHQEGSSRVQDAEVIGCQPTGSGAVSRSLASVEPAFVAGAQRLRGSGLRSMGRQRRTLNDEGFRLPTTEEASSIREACTAPLQNASRAPWSGGMEMFAAELWAEHTLQLVRSPELKSFLENNHKYYYDKNYHVDLRFGSFPVDLGHARERLKLLLGAFMRFSDAHNLHPWMAHGSLLGLAWNNLIPEYDDDLDMQMAMSELRGMQEWDQTLLEGEFLIDINPHFPYRHIVENNNNVIDARIVDTRSGVFIDITALSSVSPAPGIRRVTCKSPHFYDVDWLFPLRRSMLEGVEVWIPKDVSQVLSSEYAMNGLRAGPFKGYYFNVVSRTWQKGRPLNG